MDLSTTLGADWNTGSTGLSASALAAKKSASGVLAASAGQQDPQNAQGDTVTISAEGRSLADALASSSNADTSISGSFSATSGARSMTGGASAGAGGSATPAEVAAQAEQNSEETVRKRIEKLKEQIREAQQDPNLTDKQRKEKVERLQSELLQLETQQAQAMEKSGGGASALTYHGGTRAQGMASSLT